MKLAVLVGYTGQNFSGSQFQPRTRTVEGEFIQAGISCGAWESAKDAAFRTAGRTDKGVSARRQLISVNTDRPERFFDAMNFHLPPDIWCHGSTRVPDDFYPRYAAGMRTYRYYFPYPLDIPAMNEAAGMFVGTHNFSGFSKMEAGRDPMRTVSNAGVMKGEDGCPVFFVSAQSFLWNMVRGMAGMLTAVGLHMADCTTVSRQLAAPVWRVHPAAAEGLVFWDVETGLSFTPMRQRREVSRSLFVSAEAARLQTRTAEALMEEKIPGLVMERAEKLYGSLTGRMP